MGLIQAADRIEKLASSLRLIPFDKRAVERLWPLSNLALCGAAGPYTEAKQSANPRPTIDRTDLRLGRARRTVLSRMVWLDGGFASFAP